MFLLQNFNKKHVQGQTTINEQSLPVRLVRRAMNEEDHKKSHQQEEMPSVGDTDKQWCQSTPRNNRIQVAAVRWKNPRLAAKKGLADRPESAPGVH